MRQLTLALVTLAVGCANKEPTVQAAAPQPVFAAPVAAAPSGGVHGKVLETLEASTYTYLRLSTPTGEQWAAIPSTPVAVGTEVTLGSSTPMSNFTSKTLNRTFPSILFATGIEQAPGSAMPTAAVMKAPAPGFEALSDWADHAAPGSAAPVAGKGAPAPVAVAPVAKASGPDGKTVAEIYGDRKALKDKPVLLRGTVVKYTAGVLGKNWLHLRDGSGSADNKDNDITVTTTEQSELGAVVSVRGPVHLDRDFGAGYTFAVIIEDAAVVK